MSEDDLEARDSGNGAPWFEALCFVCATITLLLVGVALWDLFR